MQMVSAQTTRSALGRRRHRRNSARLRVASKRAPETVMGSVWDGSPQTYDNFSNLLLANSFSSPPSSDTTCRSTKMGSGARPRWRVSSRIWDLVGFRGVSSQGLRDTFTATGSSSSWWPVIGIGRRLSLS